MGVILINRELVLSDYLQGTIAICRALPSYLVLTVALRIWQKSAMGRADRGHKIAIGFVYYGCAPSSAVSVALKKLNYIAAIDDRQPLMPI
jgi:hypothetical protein